MYTVQCSMHEHCSCMHVYMCTCALATVDANQGNHHWCLSATVLTRLIVGCTSWLLECSDLLWNVSLETACQCHHVFDNCSKPCSAVQLSPAGCCVPSDSLSCVVLSQPAASTNLALVESGCLPITHSTTVNTQRKSVNHLSRLKVCRFFVGYLNAGAAEWFFYSSDLMRCCLLLL